jgi:hypothetical protein
MGGRVSGMVSCGVLDHAITGTLVNLVWFGFQGCMQQARLLYPVRGITLFHTEGHSSIHRGSLC